MRKVAVVLVVLAGCSTGFHREHLRDMLRAQAPVFDDADVAAIEQLRPQARFPLHIAVSQPISGRPWTLGELEEIASWEEPLRRAGIVRQLTVVPDTLITCTRPPCGVEEQRRAAARLGADTLLVMNPATEVDAYVNVMAPLDATIIALWAIPAHHRDALTLLEATLIDNRNQYVYAFARADGEAGVMRPFAFADQSDVAASSRLAAVQALRDPLLREMAALR